MNILVDVNLSPQWIEVLQSHGFQAVHWSQVGPSNASDRVLFDWAREHDHVVFTHDLDFSAILAATGANGPSVIQIRTRDLMPDQVSELVINALRAYYSELKDGALISIDEARSRARILPLG